MKERESDKSLDKEKDEESERDWIERKRRNKVGIEMGIKKERERVRD